MTVGLLSRSEQRWARRAGVSLILITSIPSVKAQEVTFAPVVHYPAGDSPEDLEVCDLNGDGFPDIVVDSRVLNVLFNNGFGGFGDPVVFDKLFTQSVACFDIDGDGDNDIAIGDAADGNALLFNDGAGLFTVEPGPVTTTSVVRVDGVVACDFDSDGDLDLAYVTGFDSNPKQLELFRNRGDGTFRPARTIEVVPSQDDVSGVTCVDLDGNGHDDLVTYSESSTSMVALFNDGAGRLSRVAMPKIGKLVDLAFGELDGTPGIDAAAAHRGLSGPSRTLILANDGTGDLDFVAEIATPSVHAIATCDLNLDGRIDLVATNILDLELNVVLQSDKGFGVVQTIFTFTEGNDVACIDINNDGLPDVVITSAGTDEIAVLINTTELTAP